MVNTSYNYLAFIHPDSDASMETLKKRLVTFYEKSDGGKPIVALNQHKLNVSFSEGYTFYITMSSEDHVIEEAKGFATEFKVDFAEEPFEAAKLQMCNKRFEMHGDPDFDMDYFNDSLYILEKIDESSDVVIFNIN